MKINDEKAYLLGLFVGGGEISDSSFQIVLPLDKWGMDPHIMGSIAADILTKITGRFQKNFNFPVNYNIGNNRWIIFPVGKYDLSSVVNCLDYLGLPKQGILRDNAKLAKAKSLLKGLKAENFLTGIFDARASVTKTHRRFKDDAPVVSIEIPGSSRNFRFVVDLCSWLTSMGSITDQILFNHPCQHSSADPTYKGWKKGFKIRFLVKSFITKHSFAMSAKAMDVSKLEQSQTTTEQVPCIMRAPKNIKKVSIHNEIDSVTLPVEVRKKIFFHYHHICAVMGCPYAPIKAINELVNRHEEFILAFPRLQKGDFKDVKGRYFSIVNSYFNVTHLKQSIIMCKSILKKYSTQEYPDIESGVAFLLSKKLKGKRHVGPKDKIIRAGNRNKIVYYRLSSPQNAPIMMRNPQNDRTVIISSAKGSANKRAVKKRVKVKGLDVMVN